MHQILQYYQIKFIFPNKHVNYQHDIVAITDSHMTLPTVHGKVQSRPHTLASWLSTTTVEPTTEGLHEN